MRAPKIAMLIAASRALWRAGARATIAVLRRRSTRQIGLYNLANSYARAGKPGLAVLNYERAALLAPDDPDINANLEYVRASAHVPAEPRNRFARIAQAASPTLAAWLGVLGIALVGLGLLARKACAAIPMAAGAGSVLLGVALIALSVSNAMLLWPRMHEAVVLVNQTPARVSPGAHGRHGICIAGSGDRHDDGGARGFHTHSHARRPLGVGCSCKSRRRRAVSGRLSMQSARALLLDLKYRLDWRQRRNRTTDTRIFSPLNRATSLAQDHLIQPSYLISALGRCC